MKGAAMGYRQRRLPIHYSQNYLKDPELVKKLLRRSSIGIKDTVLEIGAGKGIITTELVKVSGRVISIEKDFELYTHLKSRLTAQKNFELVYTDFLNYYLPKFPYKVFANPPFNITANIIRKLTNDDNFQDGYLVVQKEAAQKFIGMPYDQRNQMISMLLKPWFNIEVIHLFNGYDFSPRPSVDCVMIRICKLKVPLIPNSLRNTYKHFVVYSYNRKRLSRTNYNTFIREFEYFTLHKSYDEKTRISLISKQIMKKQENIHKIHRTRKDKNWRKY